MPDEPRRAAARRPVADKQVAARPFPRGAYVFGWLVICAVAAEGVSSVISGVLGTGIILLCLVPVMVWMMHIRPRRLAEKRRRR